MPKKRESDEGEQKSVSLKSLAAYLQLSPATISLVINKSPRAQSIPKTTQDRIFEAARKLNYKPNFFARSLRSKKTFTVGVLVPEAREGYSTMVIRGIENYLLDAGYFYFMASHHRRPDLIEQYPSMLMERSVEGFIMIDTVLNERIGVPVVTVSGHQKLGGVTNVVLDHRRAAELALRHLVELGHKNIAFMKGQSLQLGYGSAVGFDLPRCARVESEYAPRALRGAAGRHGFAAVGNSHDRSAVEARPSVYGIVCIQRRFGHRRNSFAAGGGIARA